MDSKDLRILFMGTADFAVPSLEQLVEYGYEVVAVVTMPDKPMGRGHKLKGSPVKDAALRLGLPLLQPENLKDNAFIEEVERLKPDLGVVVAFRMLPREVWGLPRMGTINLHGSLLPDYRGAAPIHRAVMNGDKETGVSTFILKHEIDTGDVLLQASAEIGSEDTTGDVHDRLMYIGAELLRKTIDGLASGSIEALEQDRMDNKRRAAPKIFKSDCQIDWSRSADELHNFVRGLSPYPAAWGDFVIPGQDATTAKILRVKLIPTEERHQGLKAGTALIGPKYSLEIVTGSGALEIVMLQPPGKKMMLASDYLRGLR